MKQSSPKWAETYALLIELVQKYGTQLSFTDKLSLWILLSVFSSYYNCI